MEFTKAALEEHRDKLERTFVESRQYLQALDEALKKKAQEHRELAIELKIIKRWLAEGPEEEVMTDIDG